MSSIEYKWSKTNIYIALTERKDDPNTDHIVTLLKNPLVMNKIESILDDKNTTPKNFTLHDSNHSFRVAQRMWEIIPDNTKYTLSVYELGLLLLSAYLHDIGMSPDFEKVNAHRQFLTTDNKTLLSEKEVQEFQRWIDNDNNAKPLDIRKDIVTDGYESDNILAYYIRYKHNDWSGDWIKEHLEKIYLHNYQFWYDDLIIICKSHHYGLDHLLKESFDPKPIQANNIVHRRYLSICLRIADVMENDPERTPDVILQHRSISSDSLKYWLKDKQCSLIRNGNSFSVYARPERAYIHKAIEETAHLIQNELRLCNDLIKLKPLNYSPVAAIKNYEWNLESSVHLNILPKDAVYEYIHGGFRPNMTKIIDLLGGNQLYGDPIYALRELVQNSFDAIKEKIAYLITTGNGDEDPTELLKKLGDFYTIEITLEKRDNIFWLVCKDPGVGMTKGIIENFFLESGSSKRHEIIELERKCKARGFNFGRTGQFGIGVLSYFMIADKIIVKTKRELNTGYRDDESIGWRFEINGTHDFGELSRYNSLSTGTEIELRLNSDINKDIEDWNTKFGTLLKSDIRRAPCKITYNSLFEVSKKELHYGWAKTTQDIKKIILDDFADNFNEPNYEHDDEIVSSRQRKIQSERTIQVKEFVSAINSKLHFLSEEGEIEKIGKYRIHIPFFNLTRGASFYYLNEDVNPTRHILREVFNGFYWSPSFNSIHFSLKGMRILVNPDYSGRDLVKPNCYVEVDVESVQESAVSVSRQELFWKDASFDIIEFINQKVKNLIALNENLFNNVYDLLNCRITDIAPRNYFWAVEEPGPNLLVWKKISYPVIVDKGMHYDFKKMKYKGKITPKLKPILNIDNDMVLFWVNSFCISYKCGIFNGDKVFRIINKMPVDFYVSERPKFQSINLPWKKILFYSESYHYYLNEDSLLLNETHMLFKFADMKKLRSINNVLLTRIEDLINERDCFSFLLKCILKYDRDHWIGLCEQRKGIINYVFENLSLVDVYFIQNERLYKVTNANWDIVEDSKTLKQIMPKLENNLYEIIEAAD